MTNNAHQSSVWICRYPMLLIRQLDKLSRNFLQNYSGDMTVCLCLEICRSYSNWETLDQSKWAALSLFRSVLISLAQKKSEEKTGVIVSIDRCQLQFMSKRGYTVAYCFERCKSLQTASTVIVVALSFPLYVNFLHILWRWCPVWSATVARESFRDLN